MKWTTDRPSVEGTYWLRRANSGSAEIAEIWLDEGRVDGAELCVARFKGEYAPFSAFDWELADRRYDGALWCGPITPPGDL